VLGREEDAVDSLAAVIIAKFVAGGGDMALSVADFFGWLASHKRYYDETDFWDEHSLDAQRAYESSAGSTARTRASTAVCAGSCRRPARPVARPSSSRRSIRG
jgi:hypothetical protein